MLSVIFIKMEQKPQRKNFSKILVIVCVILLYLSLIHQASGHLCGTVDVTLDLIQGGNEVAKGQWPFMVALHHVNNCNYICAGSLISKKHVLTAAHCIQRKYSDVILSPDDLVAFLGAYNITATDQDETVKVNVTEIYVHPEWDPYTPRFDADLAILLLNHSISFTKYIRPICMPTDTTDIDGATIDLNGIIVGWGLSKITNLNEIPRQASIKALNDSFCYKVDSGMATFASKRTFCGGVGEGIPELGDSGGGFYVLSDNAWVQYGIVSGIRTNRTGHVIIDSFSIYTNVRAFQKWIADTVRQTGERISEALIQIYVIGHCHVYITNNIYGCVLADLDIKKDAMVEGVNVAFTDGKTFTDIYVLTFRRGSVISFPSGLGRYFSNVTVIQTDSSFSMNSITRSSLQSFENLENLTLTCRQLDFIDDDSFWDLSNLKLIVLENTSVKTIDERVFERNENLRWIYLISNQQLECLTRDLLKHNIILELIVFDSNSLKTIDEEMFQYNVNVRQLHLPNNRLESIPENLFRNNSQLQVVDIAHNFLQTLHEKTFEQNPQLVSVTLSNNHLEFLPWNIFEHNLLLVYVDLGDNFLKTINEKIFERNSNLQFVYLSSNRLDLLPRYLFRGNSRLVAIHFNNNSIENINEQTFEENTDIQEIQMVGNKIEHLPSNLFRNNLNLVNILFGDNLLHFIDEHIFQANVALRVIGLEMNKLESLPQSLFRTNLLLEAVNLDHNFLVQIPENFFQTATKLKFVDLSSNKLDSLQVNLFKDNFELEIVGLSNNSIVYVDQQIFETNTRLTHVDLSSNKIKQISENLFANNLRLKQINFDDNLLNRIDIDFTKLKGVEKISFYNNSCIDLMYRHTTDKLTDFQRMLNSNCNTED